MTKNTPTVKIIVATHKKYEMPQDAMYLPLHVGAEGKTDQNGNPLDLGYQKDNTGENISNKNAAYCELTGLYWAWKNLDTDYTGLAHYRRHFGKKLEKEIDKKKLNKYVYMAGIQKDICGWLSTFDLFLFPSKFEGLSMAAMEAQANGVPMLASDSVIPKEVKINPSFIFWNLENSAESWAEEILNIKENINRVSQKEIVDNFTMRGYEIHTEAKKLEKILLNGVVNK